MTDEEYNERLAQLFERIRASGASNESEAELVARYQSAEFDLVIDYRLGEAFPRDRRPALVRVFRELRRRTDPLRQRLEARELTLSSFFEAVHDATESARAEFGKVLSAEEMTSLYGRGDDSSVGLRFTLPDQE